MFVHESEKLEDKFAKIWHLSFPLFYCLCMYSHVKYVINNIHMLNYLYYFCNIVNSHMLCTYISFVLFVNNYLPKIFIWYVMCKKILIYIYIYCLYKMFFQKSNAKYLNIFFKTLMLELKLKWVTIIWIGGVGCLTPSPTITELSSKKSLVWDISLP